MAPYGTLSVIENMNSENFIKISYDSERFEYVAYFRHSNIKLPDYCYTAHHRIYDGEEDKKVCRIEIISG